MRKNYFFFKSLLLATVLLLGSANAWGEVVETTVVNCNFENEETLFSATKDPGGATRITVSNAGEESAHYVNFANGSNASNGNAIATYNFSALTSDASAVDIEFDAYLSTGSPNYHHIFTIGDASTRAHTSKSINNTGAIFTFGMKRGKWNGKGSNVNYWSINNAYTTNSEANFGRWLHVKVYVDIVNKKVTYTIKNQAQTETINSDTEIAFLDGTASACTQIDYNSCLNSGSARVDNLVIKKYKDNTAEATTYTVKYQNAGGTDLKDAAVYDTYVGNTYTASSTDMATFYSNDTNTKYVYKSGNTSATATSTAASNVITLVFDEYTKYTATASAVSGGSPLQSNIATTTTYTDETAYIRLPKYLKVGGKWYVTETSNVLQTATEAGDTEVEYTASDIDYFFEETDFAISGSFAATAIKDFFSRGNGGRLSKNSYGTTEALEGGVYDLVIAGAINTQTPTMTYGYKLGDEAYVVLGESPSFSNGSYEATRTVRNIVIPDGARFCWINNTEWNSNLYVDYVTLTKVESVPVTISDAGFATLFTGYALDFTGTGLTAYTATTDGTTVNLKSVDDVQANTGVVLKGAAGAYNIPVIASSSTERGILTGSVTEATVVTEALKDEYYIYGLAVVDEEATPKEVQFTTISGGTIAKGKAFLLLEKDPKTAKSLSVVFDGQASDVTAPEVVEAEEPEVLFNMAGIPVGKDFKGYVINQKGEKRLQR